jgi:uncharacterized protein YndB with AHSA1/START domain
MKNRVVTVERIIDAPAQRIFDVLADPRQHRVFDGSGAVYESRPTAPPRLSLGAKFTMRMRVRPSSAHPADLLQIAVAIINRGRLTNTVVEFDDGTQIAWRNFGRHVWRWQLRPAGSKSTIVRETFDYSTNTFPALLELVGFPAKNATAMTASLDRLAAMVDGHAERGARRLPRGPHQ